MGKEIVRFGPNGSGALMKLVNNFMAGVQAASFAEAIALIDAAAIDHRTFLAAQPDRPLLGPRRPKHKLPGIRARREENHRPGPCGRRIVFMSGLRAHGSSPGRNS